MLRASNCDASGTSARGRRSGRLAAPGWLVDDASPEGAVFGKPPAVRVETVDSPMPSMLPSPSWPALGKPGGESLLAGLSAGSMCEAPAAREMKVESFSLGFDAREGSEPAWAAPQAGQNLAESGTSRLHSGQVINSRPGRVSSPSVPPLQRQKT